MPSIPFNRILKAVYPGLVFAATVLLTAAGLNITLSEIIARPIPLGSINMSLDRDTTLEPQSCSRPPRNQTILSKYVFQRALQCPEGYQELQQNNQNNVWSLVKESPAKTAEVTTGKAQTL